MQIDKKYLQDTIKKLELQKNKHMSDMDAVCGGIQVCKAFLLELNKKEDKKTEKEEKKEEKKDK